MAVCGAVREFRRRCAPRAPLLLTGGGGDNNVNIAAFIADATPSVAVDGGGAAPAPAPAPEPDTPLSPPWVLLLLLALLLSSYLYIGSSGEYNTPGALMTSTKYSTPPHSTTFAAPSSSPQ